MPTGPDTKIKEKRTKQNKADRRTHKSCQDWCGRNNHAWKVNLCNQTGAAYETVGAVCDRVGKKRPGNQTGISKERIGNIVRRNPRDASKNHGEQKHRKQRLNNRPGYAQRGLLIAKFDVAPGEKVEEFAIAPNFREAKLKARLF